MRDFLIFICGLGLDVRLSYYDFSFGLLWPFQTWFAEILLLNKDLGALLLLL